jgi:cytochrome P450
VAQVVSVVCEDTDRRANCQFHFAAARLVIKPIVKLVATKSRDAFMKPCLDRFDRRLRDRQATDRFDMVHLVLTGKQQVSVKELRDFSPFLIIAGGETMSSLLPCLTYLLLKHPKVLGRPRQEIRSAFAPEGPDITTDTLLRLSYLGACISEALRMYPPFVQGNDRVVPPGGASVCGLHLPGGTMVNVPHLATYHQSLNWFRPDAYHPERWLPEAGPEFERDRKASFKPFALGPQSCPGQE